MFATLFCAAAIFAAAAAPAAAQAQTTPAQDPKPATPVQEPAPAAKPATPRRALSGAATVGASLETGRTDLTGVQVQLEAKRPFSASGSFDATFNYTHATSAPPGEGTRRETVADRMTASFDIEQNLRKRLVVMLRAQALRDPVAQIHYRVGEMAGAGIRLGNERRRVRVLPGMAFFTDDMSVIDDGFRVHYGIYEDVTFAITPEWSFTHYLSVSRNVSDRADYMMFIDARLTGTVTRRVSIQLAYQYNYEKRLPPGVESRYQKTMAGLQFNF